MSVWAVLVAAGRGERLGEDRPKAFVRLGELPLLAEPLRRLDESGWIDHVIVVAPPDWEEPAILLDSVRVGVAEVPDEAEVILVHDAARPLVGEAVLQRLIEALGQGYDGAVPTLAVADTVKRVQGGVVSETLDRSDLVTVQTPQAFIASVLRDALRTDGAQATDCAALVEAAGGRVTTVEGDERLLKITTAADLKRVASWL